MSVLEGTAFIVSEFLLEFRRVLKHVCASFCVKQSFVFMNYH